MSYSDRLKDIHDNESSVTDDNTYIQTKLFSMQYKYESKHKEFTKKRLL